MSTLEISETDVPEVLFRNVSDGLFLSRDEIYQLYGSRYCMLICFDCIELPTFHCSFRFEEPIPKEIARGCYGANLEVTLLHRTSGKLIILDGCRCYHVWKEEVEKKELDDVVCMNVIKETQILTDVQCLQLATYCNIKSRNTRMKSLWERIYVTSAFYSAFMDMMERQTGTEIRNVACEENNQRVPTISDKIGKGLYLTSLFDHQLPHPVRERDINSVENLIRMTVHGCIQLVIEKDLLAAITYFCRTAPCCSRRYFNLQFFYDYETDWFQSSPLLKQILLLFVLPSFPYLPEENDDISHKESSSTEVRSRIRLRIPSYCETISCFLYSYIFRQTENAHTITMELCTNRNSFGRKNEAQLDLPLIHDIAFELQHAVFTAECNLIDDKTRKIDESLDEELTALVKKCIMKYSVGVTEKKLYLLYK